MQTLPPGIAQLQDLRHFFFGNSWLLTEETKRLRQNLRSKGILFSFFLATTTPPPAGRRAEPRADCIQKINCQKAVKRGMDTLVAGLALCTFASIARGRQIGGSKRSRTTQCGGGGRTSRSQVVKAEKLWEWYRDANYGDRPVVVTVDQEATCGATCGYRALWGNSSCTCWILSTLRSVVSTATNLARTTLTSILYFTLMGKARQPRMV